MQVCFFTLMSFLQFSWRVKKGRSFKEIFNIITNNLLDLWYWFGKTFYWSFCEQLNIMAFFNRPAFLFVCMTVVILSKLPTKKEYVWFLMNNSKKFDWFWILLTAMVKAMILYEIHIVRLTFLLKLKIPILNATLKIWHVMLYVR